MGWETAGKGSQHSSYLGVLEAKQIGLQVINDALRGSGKGDATDQKDNQHQVGKRGREINNLQGSIPRSLLLGTQTPGGAREPPAVLQSPLLRQQSGPQLSVRCLLRDAERGEHP